ncbi:hypothetical protein WA158_008476 [Blastocystis sp. Blastoise]
MKFVLYVKTFSNKIYPIVSDSQQLFDTFSYIFYSLSGIPPSMHYFRILNTSSLVSPCFGQTMGDLGFYMDCEIEMVQSNCYNPSITVFADFFAQKLLAFSVDPTKTVSTLSNMILSSAQKYKSIQLPLDFIIEYNKSQLQMDQSLCSVGIDDGSIISIHG